MRSAFSQILRPIQKDTPLTYEERLRLDLKLAKWELDCAYAGFDYATDPDLIDCYIFKLNAAMKRYKFLLERYNSLQSEKIELTGSIRIQTPAPQRQAVQTVTGMADNHMVSTGQ